MSRVQIPSEVWDAICEHYSHLERPTEQDRQVIAYMTDKINRQAAHDAYTAEKRVNALWRRDDTMMPTAGHVTLQQAIDAHRAAWENPATLGDVARTWTDERGYLCIEWTTGRWWHYGTDRTGAIVWW